MQPTKDKAMKSHGLKALLAAVALGLGLGTTGELHAQLDSFTWAEIGNPGNAADSHFGGVGSVDYTFNMSAYQTTNLQWAYFLNTVDPTGANTNGLYKTNMASDAQGGITFDSEAANGEKYSVKSGYGLLPVVYVNWNDAARFANWLHNGAGPTSSTETGAYDMSLPQQERVRMAGATYWLPNEDEWHKAAYYDQELNAGAGGYWLYPMQSDAIPNSRVPNETDANSANFYRTGGSGGVNQGFAVTGSESFVSSQLYLTEVGGYELAGSYYGTFDQGGNVWEWTERIEGSSRGLRGGSWVSFENSLRASSRNYFAPTDENLDVGFRVATVPEPSSALLILLGAAALLARRNRKKESWIGDRI